MVEEIETTEEDVAPKKGGKLKLIIILLVVLGILGGGGTFAWFKFIAPAIGVGGESDEEKEKEAEKEEPKNIEITSGPMYPLDSFILNLAGEGGKRFLKLTMELELSDENLNAEITAILPKIKDSILILLSDKTFEDVYTVDGKIKLRNEITARINRFLDTGHIRNIYFTEFVIQ
jgi:flagellar FliL protein